MLTKIFLPEKLFGKRLLSKKVISFALDESFVTASIINLDLSKTEVNILKIIPLEAGDPSTFNQRATEAIQKLTPEFGTIEDVTIAIPASSVVFKEIKVPLKNSEKISLILENEVESLLPFPIETAVIDFIITKQTKEELDTQILVAAIQKNDLEEIIQIYKNAGITPTKITIDLFSLYNLYQNIFEYKNIKNGSAIIDIKPHSTRIAFLENGELKLIRNIPKGFNTLINAISVDLNISISDCEKLLNLNGINVENHNLQNQIIEKNLIMFLNDIQFTLNSFASKLNFYKEIEKILFNWPNNQIKNFIKFASQALQTNCEYLDSAKILIDKKFKKFKESDNWTSYNISIGSAIDTFNDHEFDFAQKYLPAINQKGLIEKQVKAGLILLSTLVLSIILYGSIQIFSLSYKLKSIENQKATEIHEMLKKSIKGADKRLKTDIERVLKEYNLEILTKTFKNILDKETRAWGLLKKMKLPALENLFELIKIIDKENYNINITEIEMNTNSNAETTTKLQGLFKSKTEGQDFEYFGKFKQQLSDTNISNIIKLAFAEGELGDGGSVQFTMIFNQKEN